MDRVTAAVRTATRARGLYGVACSGGADSVALADAAIRAAGPAHVVVVTIDHGLVAGSAAVAERVATWARGQGAAAVVRRVEVARRASLEAAAREARYAALDAVCDELGLAAMLLGHTARDQAETVLLRIVRGTGPAGLAGIPPARGRFARPLLRLPRAEIDAYVTARGLPVWDDPMNADPAFARVRMRTQILPALRGENPRLDEALVRLADSAAEWLAAIDSLAAPFARLPIDCPALAAQPAAIRKRAIARALDAAALGHDAPHVAAVDRLVTRPAAGQQTVEVPGGALVRSYDALDVRRSGHPPTGSALRSGHPPTGFAPRSGHPPTGSAPRVPPGHELRTWRAGDRMRPGRLKGKSRKLSDLYGDAKIPRAERAAARVLVRLGDGAIVWAEHVGIAFDEADDLDA